MKDEKEEFSEKKKEMWKRREALLNAMSDKELRAFIKGYMMAERMVFKQLNSAGGCGGGCQGGGCQCGGGCQEGSSCKGESCGCGEKNCNCGKE